MHDGLELRKAAFECMDTLLDTHFDDVNPLLFISPYQESGLDGEFLISISFIAFCYYYYYYYYYYLFVVLISHFFIFLFLLKDNWM